MPPLPTTTIGSFPQTAEIRKIRRGFKNGSINEAAYTAAMGRQALRLPLVGPRHIETPLTETPARRQHGNTPSITAQHKNPTAQAV